MGGCKKVYIQIIIAFSIFWGAPLWAQTETIENWADRIEDVFSFEEKDFDSGFFFPGTSEDYANAVIALEVIRKEIQDSLTNELTVAERSMSLGLIKRIDSKVFKIRDCKEADWEGSVIFSGPGNLFYIITKFISQDPKKLKPILESITSFNNDFNNWHQKLLNLAQQGLYPAKSILETHSIKWSYLERDFDMIYEENFNGFNWDECIDCNFSEEEFKEYLKVELIQKMQEIVTSIEQDLYPKAHDYDYYEPEGVHEACSQAWLKFYTEDENKTYKPLLDWAFNELEDQENKMFNKILTLTNHHNIGNLNSVDKTEEIKRFMEAWRDNEAEKVDDQEAFEKRSLEFYEDYKKVEHLIHDIPTAEVVWDFTFITDYYYGHVGGGYNSDTGTAGLAAGPDTPIQAVLPVLYHEASPGHHLQFGYIKDLPIHPFLKTQATSSAFEGWGLYSEYLAAEFGLARDDYEELIYMDLMRMRILRILNILRSNFEGVPREELEQFTELHSFSFTLSFRSEVARATSWLGRDLGYYLGYLRILEMRRKAEKSLGDKFSLPDFHKSLFHYGHTSLEAMELQIDEYIQNNL